ncbi:MAG: chemotaxis protein CheA, partial [Syntrophales bacterium]
FSMDQILSLLNDIASDFLFLDPNDLDVPTAGKYMNKLDAITKEAEQLGTVQVKAVSISLNTILAKMVLDTVEDKQGALQAFSRGISIMQEITDSYKNAGMYAGDIRGFLAEITRLTGVAALQEEENLSPEITPDIPAIEEKKSDVAEIQDESLLTDFITEALEYIDEIELNVLNMEQNPEDKEYVNAVFRPFHSIKGVAGFLNLTEIRDLAHNLENLLDRVRNDELSVNRTLIDVVLDGADTLKTMIGLLKKPLEVRKNELAGIDFTNLIRRIREMDQASNDGQTKKIGEILVQDGIINEEILKEGLEKAKVPPERKLGEVLINEGKATPKQVAQALRKQEDPVTDKSTVRVDIRKLDDLIDMVGELVITHSMIQQNFAVQGKTDRNLMRNIVQLSNITSGLQQTSMSLRMVPIKQTFQRMSRLVRDLAKNSGKLVAIELAGEETEIDRNMVDEIYNPIVHMVRNSIDHGLERPEERIGFGKPEKGLLSLKAYHRGGCIVIEITDDGRGLNKEKILAKALQNGVIQSSEGLTEQEIYRLIFHAGLSTAEKVTDISGRGVGMDIVKHAVEKLRGKIDVESVQGQGTTIALRFPLTMAIIDGMIVKVGTERYILPMTAIRQVMRPGESSYTNIVGKGEVMNAMGQLFPLVRLYELFAIEPEQRNPWEAIVVVVDGGDRSKCLLVDQILGKAEVVIKGLGEGLKELKGISGGAILGDGQIGLILDPEGLFELSERS